MTIIDKKYLERGFTLYPLVVWMDFSECALEQALVQLKFKLDDDTKYTLVIGRECISDILSFKNGFNIFNINIALQDDLEDEWYLVNEKSKIIIYSVGA